jgi:pimeloyl-ACP methyl ester carboxylesterase
MLKEIKKVFFLIGAALLALVIFAIVFPMVHKTETLEPRAAAPDGNFIALDDGLTLHYYEAGKGGSVVMIHGFSSWGYTWKRNIPAVSEKYRVLAPDLPGFGFSDKPADAQYSYKLFSDTLVRFLDAKKAGRVSLIGNSMGGGVSLRFTIDHPGRVRKLVLVDSAGLRHKTPFALKMLGVPGLNTFLSSVNNPLFMRLILRKAMFFDDSAATREKADMYVLPFRTLGAMNAAARTINSIRPDFTDEDFRKIKAPTLIVWGEKDEVIYPTTASVFHRLIPGSKLVWIQKCGHLPQEERPDEFNKIILDFLK